ncbi:MULTISPECIES: TetR/AcrR family transcriptional regulator [Nonomuraea]|uniref:TetR family transcriptional regulator n=1 Tax=Nonomuraea ferruginea TaxID=46174 RepID=A0ABT4SY48_9ACTN|nr:MULTISPECIES: TetR family transcriptional regulator [Nonomuraea]MDA0641974.1 TetR family transcriptional regulator [Nonomuraea ferruginea]TXK35147.1 TetR/AcrR family transcriptional regulator [Nonomuraea sp. C10]
MKTTRQTPVAGPPAKRARKVRDAERSRIAILDAAEQLFADLGFQGASLAAIAERAYVSVGLPGYFFGSKEDLYHEVLQRVFERRDAALELVATEAEQLLEASPGDGEAALRRLIGGYVDFLLDNPTFVSLLTRDALERVGRREGQPRHSQRFADRMIRIMAQAGVVEADEAPEQLFLSLIGMCYFPLEHDATIVAGMGQRAWAQAFQEKRVAHIVRLLRPSA